MCQQEVILVPSSDLTFGIEITYVSLMVELVCLAHVIINSIILFNYQVLQNCSYIQMYCFLIAYLRFKYANGSNSRGGPNDLLR